MKKVEAIIQPSKLEVVKSALTMAGVQSLTVSTMKGFGRQKRLTDQYRGLEYEIAFAKVKIEIVVDDPKASQVIEVIKRAAKMGRATGGRIFVLPMDGAQRIRPRKRGTAAL